MHCWRRLRETYTVVDKGVKQAAQGANSRFDFTGKAQATAQAVRHQASNANKRWNLSSKARHVREDAVRALPKVRALPGSCSDEGWSATCCMKMLHLACSLN